MVQQVTKFQAQDGSLWDDRAGAEQRDLQMAIFDLIRRDAKSVKEEDARHLASVLALGYEHFHKLFDAHRAAREDLKPRVVEDGHGAA